MGHQDLRADLDQVNRGAEEARAQIATAQGQAAEAFKIARKVAEEVASKTASSSANPTPLTAGIQRPLGPSPGSPPALGGSSITISKFRKK